MSPRTRPCPIRATHPAPCRLNAAATNEAIRRMISECEHWGNAEQDRLTALYRTWLAAIRHGI